MPVPENTLQWEAIEETYDPPENRPNSYNGYTYRAKVPGGWLVTVCAGDTTDDHRWGGGVTFMPDPNHDWKIAVRSLPGRPKKDT